MAGTLKKTMIYLGLADGDDQYEEAPRPEARAQREQRMQEDFEPRVERERPTSSLETVDRDHRSERAAGSRAARPAASDREYRAPVTPIKRATQGREDSTAVRQITTVHPRSYNDAKVIGESFRGGIPVIMNVTDMSEADAKRLVDFSAGLVFGLHGSIERVTNKVFLLTPSYVEVLGEDTTVAEDQTSFFNQS